MILHLPFNNNLNDVGGNGLDGSADGGSYVNGVVGQAWSNNGNSRILVPYATPLYPGDALTFACWINLSTTTFPSTAYHFGQYEAGKRQWALTQPAGTGQPLQLYISNGISANIHSFGVALATGWTHVAITANNTARSWSLFVGGALAAGVTGSFSYANQGSHLTIGGNASGNYSNGAFDDIRFENRILSASEIMAIFNFGKGSEACEPWQRLIRPTIRRTIHPLAGAA